jgi:hypothetical protein
LDQTEGVDCWNYVDFNRIAVLFLLDAPRVREDRR